MSKLLARLMDAARSGAYWTPRDAEVLDATRGTALDVVRVDLRAATDKRRVLDAFAAALAFPEWFGGNWDALNDVLGEMAWEQPGGVVLTLANCGALAQTDPESLETALEVLDNVAEGCYDEDIPVWVFVDGIDPAAFDLPVLGENSD